VAYDLLGALQILHKNGWFTSTQYNDRLKNHKLFAYEQKDQPRLMKPQLQQDRLQGKAMSLMVHLRQASKICIKN
jgi:hypothetical protein